MEVDRLRGEDKMERSRGSEMARWRGGEVEMGRGRGFVV